MTDEQHPPPVTRTLIAPALACGFASLALLIGGVASELPGAALIAVPTILAAGLALLNWRTFRSSWIVGVHAVVVGLTLLVDPSAPRVIALILSVALLFAAAELAEKVWLGEVLEEAGAAQPQPDSMSGLLVGGISALAGLLVYALGAFDFRQGIIVALVILIALAIVQYARTIDQRRTTDRDNR